MRGPLLSGPLGSATTLEALARWLRGQSPTVVVGPVWLAATLASEIPVLALVEPDQEEAARKAMRQAARSQQPLEVQIAGEQIPLPRASVAALVLEGAAALDHAQSAQWVADMAQRLRPGGRLVALDATKDPALEARMAGIFLAAALTDLVQERPREGVVMTVGVAPSAAVMSARFPAGEAAAAAGPATPSGGSTP